MTQKNNKGALIALVLLPTLSLATIYDNRFIPFFEKTRLCTKQKPSFVVSDVFFATGSKAISNKDDEIGIAEIFGSFDQGQLSDALDLVGIQNPLRTEWRGHKIPWIMFGKIQAQGAEFSYYQRLCTFKKGFYIGLGADWMCMRVNSTQEFLLKNSSSEIDRVDLLLGPSDAQELDDTRRAMFRAIGIKEGHSHQVGVGDIDVYTRVGNMWKYKMRCRTIEAAFQLGILFPTGTKRDIAVPASIPFGGNGHYGMYGQLATIFEVKEDIKIGADIRFGGRFSRTQYDRIPVIGESILFGVMTGSLKVNPGVTFNFAPFFMCENLRDGLGARVKYVLTLHQPDELDDDRGLCTTKPAVLSCAEKQTGWASSYVSVNVFYDFGRIGTRKSIDHAISLDWDIPAMLFSPKRVAQTHKITLGISMNF